MNKIILLTVCFILCAPCFADYIQFDSMDTYKCSVNDTIYNSDNSVVSQNDYTRIYRLDDSKNQIYLQKSPVDSVGSYGPENVEFTTQSMTDDFIMSSLVKINRKTGELSSYSTINYDNPSYGQRFSKASGTCILQK